MTVNKLKKEIIRRLDEKGIEVNCIKVKGYKENIVRSIEISVYSYSNKDVLGEISGVLNDIHYEYGICVEKKLLEF